MLKDMASTAQRMREATAAPQVPVRGEETPKVRPLSGFPRRGNIRGGSFLGSECVEVKHPLPRETAP